MAMRTDGGRAGMSDAKLRPTHARAKPRAAALDEPPQPQDAGKPLSWRLSLLAWAVMAASAWGLCALVLHFL